MDGPNVHWRVFKALTKDTQAEENVTLLNIGSCGLHVVYNSFKLKLALLPASEWDLASLLRSLYYLFKDAPTRKAGFLKLGSSKLSLTFCGHRWLENANVGERAIEIWPFIVQYVSEVKRGKLSNPTCASFKTLAEFEKDELIVAKLHSFLLIAKILKPFLTKFQSSEPLAPFLCSDLFDIVKRLYGLILKESFLDKLDKFSDLVSPNDIDKCHYRKNNAIDVGFQASGLIDKEKKTSDLKEMEFRMSFQKFVKACISKILEKSPLEYKFAQDITFLNPKVIQHDSIDSKTMFRDAVSQLVSCNRISADIVDDAIHQFGLFKSIIKAVPYTHERIDKFYNENGQLDQFPDLQRVIHLILILSHGNADVERGFSVNKEVTIENLVEEFLVARRLTSQFISGEKASKVTISPDLLESCSKAWIRYFKALKEKKESKTILQKDATRQRKHDEVMDLKTKKKKKLENDIDNLIKTADDLGEKVENASSKVQLGLFDLPTSTISVISGFE